MYFLLHLTQAVKNQPIAGALVTRLVERAGFSVKVHIYTKLQGQGQIPPALDTSSGLVVNNLGARECRQAQAKSVLFSLLSRVKQLSSKRSSAQTLSACHSTRVKTTL